MVVHAVALLAVLSATDRAASLAVNPLENLVLTWRVRNGKLTLHLVPEVSDVDALAAELSRGIWQVQAHEPALDLIAGHVGAQVALRVRQLNLARGATLRSR